MKETHIVSDENTPISEILKVSLEELALTREDIETNLEKVAACEAELEDVAPETLAQIHQLTQGLVDLRKEKTILEGRIRTLAKENPEIAKEMPYLSPRASTEVEVPDAFALEIARVFCPSAIKVDRKIFDKWAIANCPNPLLPIVVKKVPGFTIKSDLSELAAKTKQE